MNASVEHIETYKNLKSSNNFSTINLPGETGTTSTISSRANPDRTLMSRKSTQNLKNAESGFTAATGRKKLN